MAFQLIVSAKYVSQFPETFEAGDEWSVEGDYGFIGSFKTQTEAWKFAEAEIAGKYNGGVVLDAEITLNS